MSERTEEGLNPADAGWLAKEISTLPLAITNDGRFVFERAIAELREAINIVLDFDEVQHALVEHHRSSRALRTFWDAYDYAVPDGTMPIVVEALPAHLLEPEGITRLTETDVYPYLSSTPPPDR